MKKSYATVFPTQASSLTVTLAILCGGFAASSSPLETDSETSVREIVDASLEATGGPALDEVKSVRRVGSIHIESDLFGVLDGDWEIAFRPGSGGFQRSIVSGSATTIAWDGTSGWEQSPAGLRELNAEEIVLNRWLWEMSWLHAMVRDHDLEALERMPDVTLNGVLHHVLAHTDSDGIRTMVSIDSESGLVSRVEGAIELPMVGSSKAATDFLDYADVGGVKLPRAWVQVIDNLWVVEATFDEIELDVDLADSLFGRPSDR